MRILKLELLLSSDGLTLSCIYLLTLTTYCFDDIMTKPMEAIQSALFSPPSVLPCVLAASNCFERVAIMNSGKSLQR
jgi:hypothetical protein